MSLSSTLDTTKAAVREALPPAIFGAIEQSIADLRASGLADKARNLGDTVALPILDDLDGRPIDLAKAAAGRPVLLLFYRGGWCPYCNATLRAYAEALPRIEAAGGTLLAVTPESAEHASGTVRDGGLTFPVAIDRGNRFAASLGLVFALPDELRPLYHDIGIDLPARNGDESYSLPIPAIYVLDAAGRIVFAHIDADFTRRAEPEAAVAALERLGRSAVAAADRTRATLP